MRRLVSIVLLAALASCVAAAPIQESQPPIAQVVQKPTAPMLTAGANSNIQELLDTERFNEAVHYTAAVMGLSPLKTAVVYAGEHEGLYGSVTPYYVYDEDVGFWIPKRFILRVYRAAMDSIPDLVGTLLHEYNHVDYLYRIFNDEQWEEASTEFFHYQVEFYAYFEEFRKADQVGYPPEIKAWIRQSVLGIISAMECLDAEKAKGFVVAAEEAGVY